MLQQMSAPTLDPPIDELFTAAAQTWNTALSKAGADREAQSYGRVVSLLAEQFKSVTTIRALLYVSATPDSALLRRVARLCELSGVRLDPRVALDATCALRLLQLQDGALA
jgi:hypothetical protein